MHRIRSIVSLAAASLAIAAVPAGAAPTDLRGEAARAVPAAAPLDLRGEAARSAGAATSTPSDLRSPDARTGTGTRTPVVPDPVVVRIGQPSADGISWDSAVLGGLIASGLLITLAGSGMVVTRRRVSRA